MLFAVCTALLINVKYINHCDLLFNTNVDFSFENIMLIRVYVLSLLLVQQITADLFNRDKVYIRQVKKNL
jgi:hypothetical protein